MRIRPGYTDLFLSPVTGKLATSSQLPGLSPEYTYLGNELGETQPSPIIIDIRLDLISLRKLIPIDVSDSSFLLKNTDARLPNSQSLESLKVDGLLKTVTNTLHLAVANTDYLTPDLLENKVWIGDENNKAAQSDTIGLDNLPSLTKEKVWQGDGNNRPIEVFLDYLTPDLAQNNLWIGNSLNRATPKPTISLMNLPSLTKGKVWQGDSLNRPEEAEIDLAPTDATYILQKPTMSLPNAQALSELMGLDPRILKASVLGEIEVAIADEDYATKATLERLKSETEEFKTQAQQSAEGAATSAEEAAASATEASASATEATGAAAEATGAASAASASAFSAGASEFAAGVSAFAAAASASSASGSSSSASDSSDRAKQSAEASQNSATSSQGSAISAATSLTTLLATGLNALPNHGDVNFQGFKAIHAGTPTLPDDLTTKGYVDSAISGGSIPVKMTGFVQGLEGADGNLVSTRGDTCLLSTIPAGGDINAETHKLINLGTPVDATDATTKAYVDTAISSSHIPLQLRGFVQGLEQEDGSLDSIRGNTCLLSSIPAGGDVDLGMHKVLNLGTPINDADAATKAYVDSAISGGGYPIHMSGFVEGIEGAKGELVSTRGPTCLLTNIPAGGDVDMGNFRLKNLQQSPEEDFDGISATFLWDLMHDEVQILWS